MRFKLRSDSPLKKKARRGFRGYPVAPVAFCGPDDRGASKVSGGILSNEDGDPDVIERWFVEEGEARTDPLIARAIVDLIRRHGAMSVLMAERIIGCPHEEGIDYPDGGVCPQCPFWANRDRWTGELMK